MAEELDVAGLTLHPTSSGGEQVNGVLGTESGSGATSKPTTGAKPTGPIPMSMPSILRNTGTPSYLLNQPSSSYPPTNPTRTRRKEPSLGRRKQRRSENLRLLTTPSARPTPKDYRLHSNAIKSTFSSAAAKSVPVPSSSKAGFSEPNFDAYSANQGYFGTSLKDAQRTLRSFKVDDEMIREGKAGELERFIWLVEREIRTWSCADVFLFNTTTSNKTGRVLLDDQFNFPQSSEDINLDDVKPGGLVGQVVEFQRTPNALVWLVEDPFLRLVVHCLSRVLKCPSFSKDDTTRPGLRFTWILNPNPMARKRGRRGRRVSVSSDAPSTTTTTVADRVIGLNAGMDTPPTTDFDSQTESEVETDTDAEADGLAGSMVLVPPPGQEVEEERNVDTDEEEVEILRRVRRWAIDSGRQRRREDAQVGEESAQQGDPDRTLMAADVIDEEQEEEEEFDEEDEYGESSDDGDDDETQLFLIRSLEHDPIRLRDLHLHTVRYRQQYGMRVTQPDVQPHIRTLFLRCFPRSLCSLHLGLLCSFGEEERLGSGESDVEFGATRERVRFDGGAVTYADEFERDCVAFRYAVEGVVEEGAGETPGSALTLLRVVLDGEGDAGGGGGGGIVRGGVEQDALVERDDDFALWTADEDGFGAAERGEQRS
ncbi:hypothetical protein PHSY_000981 [Pseudozyma hubeiensis SY62]|uniref:Uncharacterized protein n=1 Tax=Pseudozyma hubeiensis (strain SY62) TaxID=1305764 RepID=R9NXT5_PSEHS|nr:hypothetical protein PHSY_000981 [Pseudozyma hubeiensis SY62]GAC93416.1 hypothetical protein PHSY_000981 [Pseudozyma hubeiensis SY62]